MKKPVDRGEEAPPRERAVAQPKSGTARSIARKVPVKSQWSCSTPPAIPIASRMAAPGSSRRGARRSRRRTRAARAARAAPPRRAAPAARPRRRRRRGRGRPRDPAARSIAASERSTSVVGGGPRGDADPHRRPGPARRSRRTSRCRRACIAAMTRRVRSASPNETSTWFSTTSFSTRWPAAASPSAKRRRVAAAALDQLGEAARGPSDAQRRPDLDAARAARQLGRVVGRDRARRACGR